MEQYSYLRSNLPSHPYWPASHRPCEITGFSLAVLFYVILKGSAWQSLSDRQNGEGLVQLFVFRVVVGLGPRAPGTPGSAPPPCCYGLPRVSAPPPCCYGLPRVSALDKQADWRLADLSEIAECRSQGLGEIISDVDLEECRKYMCPVFH